MKPKAIALHSGGLDSTVAIALAMREVDVALALTFDYGQRARERETQASRSFCREHGIEHRAMRLPWLAELGGSALTDRGRKLPEATPDALDAGARSRAEAVWVPNRNGLFIAIAACFAESTGAARIVAGFNAEEAATFPDNGSEFIEATGRALALSTLSGVSIMCPTEGMTKAEIARQFAALELRPESLWCCYEGGERPCGRCESCARTIRAFRSQDLWERMRGRFAEGG